MKNSLEQRIINARPDNHPSNPEFVAKTMAAVKASSARETFSHVNRRIDETNKKGLFMKLRSLSKPALAAIAIAVIVVVSGTVYAAYQITHQHPTPKPSQPIGSHVTPDPTKNWTAYSSTLGKFSLRYPNAWVQPTGREFCTPGLFDRSLYLGPNITSVLTCGSENFGQMSVSSVDGDKRADYELSPGYKNVVKKNVTIDGVTGQRISGVAVAPSINAIGAPLEGTIEVHYVFYTNGITYSARYTQNPPGHNPSTDVLKDFDLMVTKTLTFTKSSPVATSPVPTYTAGAACQGAQLSFALDNDLGSLMNQPAAFYSFTNISPATCTLTGYPSIKLYDASNNLIPGTVTDDGAYQLNDPGPTSVSIAPGVKVYFGFGWGALYPSPSELPSGCIKLAALEALAPGTTTVFRNSAPLKTDICQKGGSVTAIAPAAAFTVGRPN